MTQLYVTPRVPAGCTGVGHLNLNDSNKFDKIKSQLIRTFTKEPGFGREGNLDGADLENSSDDDACTTEAQLIRQTKKGKLLFNLIYF